MTFYVIKCIYQHLVAMATDFSPLCYQFDTFVVTFYYQCKNLSVYNTSPLQQFCTVVQTVIPVIREFKTIQTGKMPPKIVLNSRRTGSSYFNEICHFFQI